MISWFAGLKPQTVFLATALAVTMGSIVALVWRVDSALDAAYDRGRTDVLLEVKERSVELRERLTDADKGAGDADEDLDWILRELDALGVQLDDPGADAATGQ